MNAPLEPQTPNQTPNQLESHPLVGDIIGGHIKVPARCVETWYAIYGQGQDPRVVVLTPEQNIGPYQKLTVRLA